MLVAVSFPAPLSVTRGGTEFRRARGERCLARLGGNRAVRVKGHAVGSAAARTRNCGFSDEPLRVFGEIPSAGRQPRTGFARKGGHVIRAVMALARLDALLAVAVLGGLPATLARAHRGIRRTAQT